MADNAVDGGFHPLYRLLFFLGLGLRTRFRSR
jgi:hypothetical protein